MWGGRNDDRGRLKHPKAARGWVYRATRQQYIFAPRPSHHLAIFGSSFFNSRETGNSPPHRRAAMACEAQTTAPIDVDGSRDGAGSAEASPYYSSSLPLFFYIALKLSEGAQREARQTGK